MKRAQVDWPVWFQILGALAVIVAVGILAGAGWALLSAGAMILIVGVFTELDRAAQQRPPMAGRPAPHRPAVPDSKAAE